ncbi:MAG: VWA domain-containing protein [Fimbriimonadaceae bacterium]
MRFIEPLLGLLFIPVLFGLFLSWRRVHGMVPLRKGISFGLRFLLFGALIIALMGPQAVRANKGLTTIFVVDRSDSVSDVDRKRSIQLVNEAMGAMGEDDRIGVVAFGRAPVMEASPGGRRPFSDVESVIDGSASDLAASLRLAMASFPSGKGRRIVVLSDGNETKGDALGAIESISAEGVAVDFVPLGLEKSRAEASVLELQTPSEQAADQPFELRAVVESSVAQSGQLIIERNGEPVSQVPVSLPTGTSTIVVSQELKESGFYRYRAYLKVPQDSDNRNNLGASFVAVKGRPKVLLIQGDTLKRELATALSEQGISVQLGGASMMPARQEDLQAFDAVILNDFNAAQTTEIQMKMVRNAVRDSGIGFMMIGGEDSFLPGGWFGTPIAEALPVDLNVRQRKVFPNTSVMIVVDTSGSMSMNVGGMTKLQLAASAAVLSTQLLSAKDRLGVAGSGSRIDYVAPLAELTKKDEVVRKIKTLKDGGGGIFAEPSVQFANDKLRAENSKVRHFILVADGSDCDTHGTSLAIASAMKADKITVSTVAIGDGKDVPFLKGLAAVGGGRYYFVEDAKKLPQIFTQDVSLMSRSAIEEGAFIPKILGGDEVTRGISGFPALMAYCLTDARPLARVTMKTHKDDPLLASWQFGLGKSMAFTSDAQNRWAKEWIGWGGYGQFWAQAVRSLTRRAAVNNYDLQVTPDGGKGKISLQARDRSGNPLAASSIEVRVSDPEGNSQKATLIQEAPGVFSGNFDASNVGSYIVSVVEPTASGEARVAANGFSIPYPPEYRSSRPNLPLLEGLASVSSGKKLADGWEAMRAIENRGESVADLWRLFLWIALGLLPLDVLMRRVVVPLPKFGRREVEEDEVVAKVAERSVPGEKRPKIQRVKRKKVVSEEPISAAGSLLAAKKKRKDSDSSEND